MAAHRGAIKTVIIPHENKKDLVDISDDVKADLEIKPVKWIDEVLEIALTELPVGENVKKSDDSVVKEASEKGQTKPAPRH